MDWLTDNPIVNMPGPNFLGFYAIVSLIVLLAFNVLVRTDGTNQRAPPFVPTRPDPYEIAYLRGGVGAVISLAIYSLKRSQTIEMQAGGNVTSVPSLGPPANPLEARVLEELGPGASLGQVLSSRDLRASIFGQCETFRQRLARQDLVMTDAARQKTWGLGIAAAIALGGLAALKIFVAQSHGHKNVGFLFGVAIVAVMALIWSVKVATRSVANRRGRAYLERVKSAYVSGSGPQASGGSYFDPIASAAALLAVGAIGLEALHGTSDEAFAREFVKNSGGGASGSCSNSGGGCGGGGGGGCGGCGGGGD
jgi:uncharacterized protein (TIGR04222 family)